MKEFFAGRGSVHALSRPATMAWQPSGETSSDIPRERGAVEPKDGRAKSARDDAAASFVGHRQLRDRGLPAARWRRTPSRNRLLRPNSAAGPILSAKPVASSIITHELVVASSSCVAATQLVC